MRSLAYAFILLAVGFSQGVRADVAVLVHGYLGNAGSWEFSGVNHALALNGWQPVGVVVLGPSSPLLPPPTANAPRKTYSVELPSMEPLMMQSDMLIDMLRAIRGRHPKESITLIGHSAGGVIARMALVRGGADGVTRLITIASPHLGTERALQALDATQESGPVGFVKNIFGGRDYRMVRDSWPVLVDLTPAVPGSALFWLNAQTHPNIKYISIVRSAPFGIGDQLVPGPSQDLRNVPSIGGKALTYIVPAGHTLVPADGAMLAQLMR